MKTAKQVSGVICEGRQLLCQVHSDSVGVFRGVWHSSETFTHQSWVNSWIGNSMVLEWSDGM